MSEDFLGQREGSEKINSKHLQYKRHICFNLLLLSITKNIQHEKKNSINLPWIPNSLF